MCEPHIYITQMLPFMCKLHFSFTHMLPLMYERSKILDKPKKTSYSFMSNIVQLTIVYILQKHSRPARGGNWVKKFLNVGFLLGIWHSIVKQTPHCERSCQDLLSQEISVRYLLNCSPSKGKRQFSVMIHDYIFNCRSCINFEALKE